MAMARVQIVGEKETPYALAEALGSEMMGNIDNQYPTQWAMAQPAAILNCKLQSIISNILNRIYGVIHLHRLRFIACAI